MLDFEKIVEYRNKHNRFARKLGITVESISPGGARVVKTIEEDDLNPLGRAHDGDFGYVKLARVISGDVKRLGELGLNGYVSCQELRAGLPSFFPNYVLGRTLMDREADVNQLMEEYFSAAYGEDWSAVSDYLFRLSSLSSTVCC